jgi:hypothetical protein
MIVADRIPVAMVDGIVSVLGTDTEEMVPAGFAALDGELAATHSNFSACEF